MAYRLRLLGQLGRNFSQLVTHGCPRISYGNVRFFRILSRLDVDAQKILMPALSPTMSEGTIVKWHKTEGESIAAGDVLCDIETDKAVVSMEVDEDGIVAKIIKPENTKNIQVGSLIALMVAEGEDWKDVDLPSDAVADSAPPTPPPSAAISACSSRTCIR
ncbi:Pyruvate dehydrogenase protein X component [Lamellibrachia satsuma]|nr:Pyruvate dehydrogenase protein X component [Lamellibrachia satsuma]